MCLSVFTTASEEPRFFWVFLLPHIYYTGVLRVRVSTVMPESTCLSAPIRISIKRPVPRQGMTGKQRGGYRPAGCDNKADTATHTHTTYSQSPVADERLSMLINSTILKTIYKRVQTQLQPHTHTHTHTYSCTHTHSPKEG